MTGLTSRVRTRTPVRGASAIGMLAAAGLVAGAAAKVADESGVQWAGDLGTYPAAWVLALVLVSRFAPSPRAAAARATVFFVAMCIGYYTWSAVVLGFGWGPEAYPWLVLAVTAVPAAAAVASWATNRRRAASGAVIAAGAAVALSGGAARQVWLYALELFPRSALHPVQAALEVLIAIVIVLMLPRDRATRAWAAVLLVPLAWQAPRALDLAYRFAHEMAALLR